VDKSIGGDDLSKMIGSRMADKKFGEILSSVKDSLSAKAENKASEDTADEIRNDADDTMIETSASPISAIPQLSPELLSKLPAIMSMLSGGDNKAKNSSSSHLSDRKCLLQALKPFLSNQRREAVDSILNVAGIADLFGL